MKNLMRMSLLMAIGVASLAVNAHASEPVLRRVSDALTVTFTPASDSIYPLDSNNPTADGPDRGYYAVKVTNTGATTAVDVRASLALSGTGWALAGSPVVQPTEVFLGSLAPGASKTGYWYISYPRTLGATGTATVTVTNNLLETATYARVLRTVNAISSGTGGQLSSVVVSSAPTLGGLITYDVTYEFGGASSGHRYFFSPAGNVDFNAGCFQLTGSRVISSDVTAIPVGLTDQLFAVATATQTGSGHLVTVRYTLASRCISATSYADPWAAQTSGTQYKYSSNYGTRTSPVVPPLPSSAATFTVSKTGSDTLFAPSGKIRYTVTIRNTGTTFSVIDSIVDVLPSGAVYDSLSTSSGVTAAKSASLPVAGATGTLRFRSQPDTITGYRINAGDSLKLIYWATLSATAGTYSNSATAYIANVALGSGTVSHTARVASADVSITKTLAAPAVPKLGDTLVYVLTTANAGPSAATGVTISDSLPTSGVTFLSATNSGVHASGVVTWPAVTMAPGTSRADTVRLATTASGSVTNIARVTAITFDIDSADRRSSVTSTVAQAARVSVTKSYVGPATPYRGDTLVWTIVTANATPANTTNITLTDSLPAGLVLASATNSGTAASGVVSWPVFSLAAGASRTDTIRTVANTDGVVTNIVRASSSVTDTDTTNNRATANATVAAVANVSTSKALGGPASPRIGDTLVYVITTSNAGPSTASGIVVADSLPSGTSFVSATNSGSFAAGVVTFPAFALASSATRVDTILAVATASGSLTNVVRAAGTALDPDTSTNRGSINTTVAAVADLSVVKSLAAPASPRVGDTLVYVITTTNSGPSIATSVALTDSLPSGSTWVSASNSGVHASGVVSWTAFSLANGASRTDTVRVVAGTPSSVTNVARVSSPLFDPDSADRRSAVTSAIAAVANLSVAKGLASPASPKVGDTLVYVITTTNVGPSAATLVTLTDSLPSGTSFLSASNSGSQAAGVVTWPSVTLASGATRIDTVRVVSTTSGSITNVVRVSSAAIDPDSLDNRSTNVATVAAAANVSVTKVLSAPASPRVGDTLVYVITTTNAGPSTASAVALRDSLPASATFVSASNSGSVAGSLVSWPSFSLSASSSRVDTVRAIAGSTGAITNVVRAASPEVDVDTTNNRATTGSTIAGVANVALSKTLVAPATPRIGDTLVYVLTLSNSGPSTASGITMTDSLPTSATFASATGGGVHASGVVTWSSLSLASGASRVDTVRAVATATGSLVNVARASGTTFDPDSANNRSSTTTSVAPVANLSTVKSLVAPATPGAGDTLTFVITTSNAGPSAATGVSVIDSLPAGTTFVSASSGGVHASGVVTWSALTIANGASRIDTVRASVASAGTYTNIARASGSAFDPDTSGNRSTAVASVAAVANISVAKSLVSPSTPRAGDTLVFALSVTNAGPSGATAVTLRDSLPAGTTFVSATNGATQSGSAVTWPAFALASGGTRVDTIRVLVPASGSITNVARVSSPETDPDTTGNRDTEAVTVAPSADVSVNKQFVAPAAPLIGDTLVFTITTANAGPSASTGITLVDSLPAGVTFVSATNGGSNASGVVSWAAFSLSAGASRVDTVRAVATTSGALQNVARVGTSVFDSDTADHRSSATATPGQVADLALVKTMVSPASPRAGDTLTYVLTLTNAGPSSASNVTLSDSLPTGGALASVTNGGTAAGNVISWPAFSLASGGTRVDTVRMVAPAAGSYINVARVSASEADPDSADRRSTVTTAVAALARLSVAKTLASPATPRVGDTLVYVITSSNAGPSSVSDATLRDSLPSGVTFVSATNGGTAASGVVSWAAFTLANGASRADTVRAVATTASAITNIARLTSATADSDTTDNRASTATTVAASANLTVSKTTVAPATPGVGDTVVFVITTSNAGPSSATGIALVDSLPAGLSFASATNSGSVVGSRISWPVFTLSAAASRSDTVRAVATAAGTLTNVARVSANEFDADSTGNRATANAVVGDRASLSIAKTLASPVSPKVGDTLTYVLTTANGGPSTAAGITLVDSLPSGTTFVSATNGASNASGVLTWAAFSLANGATRVDTVRATATASGSLTNIARAASTTADTSLVDNRATAVATVAASANLAVSKTLSGPATPRAGDTLIYVVTSSNSGPSTATGVALTDSLPAGVTFISATNTGTHLAGVVSWPGFSLASGASRADTVRVSVTLDGTYTNIARVGSAVQDGDSTNNRASLATIVAPRANLALVKSLVAPASPKVGDTLVYVLVTSNSGPSSATGIALVDSLPAGATYATATNTPVHASGVLSWPTFTLASGASRADTVRAVATTSGTLTNIARATSSVADPDSANNRSTTASAVGATADISMVKSLASPASPKVGDTLVYVLVTSNAGPSAVSDITVIDSLPATVTYVSATNTPTVSGLVLTWSAVSLASGASRTDTVRVVATAAAALGNIARASSSATDPVPTNNRHEIGTTVAPVANLTVSKVLSAPASPQIGDTVTWVLTTANAGPSSATSIALTDSLPAGVTFVSATNGGSNASGVVSWATFTLTNGASRADTVRAVVGSVASITNIVRVSSPVFDPDSAGNRQAVTTGIGAVANLGVTKSLVAPATPRVGDTLVYVITSSNAGPSAVSDATLRDSLPSGVTFVSATNGGTAAAGVVSWAAFSLANGASRADTVRAVAATSGSITNIVRLSSATSDPDAANNRATTASTIAAVANLTLVKTLIGPASPKVGDTLVYQLVTSNAGPSTASSIALTDSLPSATSYAAATNTPVHASGVLTWATFSLASGASRTDTVRTVVTSASALVNVARVSSPVFDPDTAGNRSTTSHTAAPVANLAISKSLVAPASPKVGDTLVYVLTSSNSGPSAVSDATLRDSLPSGVTFVSATNGGTVAAGVVSWTAFSLASGASRADTVRAIAAANGSLLNVARLSSSVIDSDTTNNRATVNTTVAGVANISVSKTLAAPASPKVGDTLTYVITTSNAGPSTASNVAISDSLPSSVTFASASNGGSVASGVVSWSVFNLANGASRVDTVRAVATTSGSATNVVRASSPTTDPDSLNNRGTTSNTIAAVANLSVAKSLASPASPQAGDTLVYVITSSNAGPSAVTDATLRDSLPTGTTFVSATNGGSAAAGVVSWSTFSLGSGASRADTVRVIASAVLSVTNVARLNSAVIDPDSAGNRTSVTTGIGAVADVSLAKVLASPASPRVGDTLVYVLTTTNSGPSSASSITMRDSLPSGLSFVSATSGGVHASGVITWTAFGLANGASRADTVRAVATASGSMTNVARISSTTTDPDTTDHRSAPTTTVAPVAQLSVSKVLAAPAAPRLGDTLVYVITTANAGPSTADNVLLRDSLPGAVTWASATNGGVHASGVVTWATFNLTAGTSRVDTVRAVATSTGGVTNVVRASTPVFEADTSNNRSTVASTIAPVANIAITKTLLGPASPLVGDTLVYQLTVSNAGPSTATSIALRDSLPSNTSFVSGSNTPTHATGVVTWPAFSLTSGSSRIDTVRTIVTSAGAVLNVARATAAEFDPDSVNNRSTASGSAGGVANLAISKVLASPASPRVTDTLVYVLTTSNSGPSTALGVALQDSLPAGATMLSASNGGTVAGGVVTWATFTLNSGASRADTVRLVPAVGASVTNVARVNGTLVDSDTSNNRSAITSALSPVANVTVAKSLLTTGLVQVGDTVAFAIVTSNSGPSAAAGIVVTDSLPTGLSFATATSGGTASGNVVSWPSFGLAAAASRTDTVRAVATAPGPLTNIVRASTTTFDSDSTGNRGTAAVSVGAVANLAIVKTLASPASPKMGDTLVFVLQSSNAGPSAATGVTLSDSLPVGLTFTSATNGATAAGRLVTWPAYGLAAAASRVDTVRAVAATSGSLTNVARIGSLTTESDPTNNRATAPVSIAAVADISVGKALIAPTSPRTGDTLVFTISTFNNGPSATSGVTLIDSLPSGLTYVSGTNGAAHAGGVVTWPGFALAAGAARVDTVRAIASTTGSFTNIARASSPAVDGVPGNNRATATAGVNPPQADLVMSKRLVSPAAPRPGDTLIYVIETVNNGPAAASAVSVIDSLPSGTVFVSATSSGTHASGVVTWPVFNLSASARRADTVRVVAPSAGVLTNVARASSATADPDGSNNRGVVTTTVAALTVDVAVTKTLVQPSAPKVGDTLIYQIVTTNRRSTGLSGLTLIDSLPTGLVYVSSTGGTSSGSEVRWSNVSLAANAVRIDTVRARATGAGQVINTALILGVPGDSTPGDNRATNTTNVSGVADLSVSKQLARPTSPMVGDTLVYIIRSSNAGPSRATGLSLVDSLPSNLTFLIATNNPTNVSGVLTWPAFDLDSGAVRVDSVRAIVRTGASVRNVAVLTGNVTDPTPGNNSSSTTTSVGSMADVSVDKALATAGAIGVGDTVRYVLTRRNHGPAAAANVTMVDTLPGALSWVRSTGGSTHSTGVVSWPGIPLDSGAVRVDTVVTVARDTGRVVNVAWVRSGTADSSLVNNVDSVTHRVEERAALSVTKRLAAPTQPVVGDTLLWVITVTNGGPSGATGVTLVDTLPTSVRFVSASRGATHAAGVVAWPAVNLDLGATRTDTVRAVALAAGTLVNVVTAQSRTSGAAVAVAQVTTQIGTPLAGALTLEKIASTRDAEVTDIVRYTLRVRSTGPGTAAPSIISDRLPAGFVLVPGSLRVDGQLQSVATGTGNGFTLSLPALAAGREVRIEYAARVAASATLGDGINRATLRDSASGTEVARALQQVTVRAGVFGDEGMIVGRVWTPTSCSSTSGETGIAGVRVMLQDGTSAVTDAYGRYAFTNVRPRLWVVRFDIRTLPLGATVTDAMRNADASGQRFVNVQRGELARADMQVDVSSGSCAGLARSATVTSSGDAGLSASLPSGAVTTGRIPVLVRVAPARDQRPGTMVTLSSSNGTWNVEDEDLRAAGLQVMLGDSTREVQLMWEPRGDTLLVRSEGTGAAAEVRLTAPDTRERFILSGLAQLRYSRSTTRGLAWDPAAVFSDSLASVRHDAEWGSVAGRAALVASGEIADGVRFTARYDSERDRTRRMFADIRPDEGYPLFGDVSSQQFEMQARSALFARLSTRALRLTWGDLDLQSSAPNGVLLGRFSRAMTGGEARVTTGPVDARAWVSQNRQAQVVDEFDANGTSGPFPLRTRNGLLNTEIVEVITYARDNPGMVVDRVRLERFTDYTLEPFSGRLILRRAVRSADDQLNPVRLRVSYEGERSADATWVYGGDAALNIGKSTVGAAWTRDDAATGRLELASAFAQIALADGTVLSAEAARSDSAGVTSGVATRLELRHTSKLLTASLRYGATPQDFANPSNPTQRGREDLSANVQARLASRVWAFAEYLRSTEDVTDRTWGGWHTGLRAELGKGVQFDVGYRDARTTQTASGDLEDQTVRARLSVTPGDSARATFFAEGEQSLTTDRMRAFIGGDIRLPGQTALFMRHELGTSGRGAFDLDPTRERSATVIGLRSAARTGMQTWSEFRVDDAIGGREARAVIGLSNRWKIGEGRALEGGFERIATEGLNPRTGWSASAGWSDLSSEARKLTARLEHRNDPLDRSWLGSFGLAQRLGGDFSLLAQSTMHHGSAQDAWFERSRLGIAWRGSSEHGTNLLSRYEHRSEPVGVAQGGARSAHILATHADLAPTDFFSLRGQWALKRASDPLETGATTAQLLSGRGTISLTRRLDLGAAARTLFGTGDASAFGAGTEFGVLLGDLRFSIGYNWLGLRDRDLGTLEPIGRGLYIDLSARYTEGLFGIGRSKDE